MRYFDSANEDFGKAGSKECNKEVFRRAFVVPASERKGPFQHVIDRLELGFSVLVYLPGNCMQAAAEVVKSSGWKILGRLDKADSLSGVWKSYTGLFDDLKSWFDAAKQPHVIFLNLDMLSDGGRGLDQTDDAKTALLYLTECVRTGVVLGLSDLRAGELPDPIRRPFAEEVYLSEVSFDRFPSLIPKVLADRLAGEDQHLSASAEWLLASRLRWTDPLRAVRIMESLATGIQEGSQDGDGSQDRETILRRVLARAAEATRTARFVLPYVRAERHDCEDPKGFEPETVRLLKSSFIEPYREWAAYSGADSAAELRKLPRGLILFGPPGTGKTTLARWVAERIGIPVCQVSAADLKRPDWGQTERMVEELFASARRAAPCAIVLDDAEDLLRERSGLQGDLASAEGGVVSAFLRAIEGYSGPIEGVLIILTTNQFSALDKAARSRLSRHIKVPYPLTQDQVEEIVQAGVNHYSFKLDASCVQKLKEFFWEPRQNTVEDTSKPDVRRRAASGLWAPRDILAAMQLMVGDDPGGAGFTRMKTHYEGLKTLNLNTFALD